LVSPRPGVGWQDPSGRPGLLELELTEPSLFLPQAPAVVDRLTPAVTDLL
jgi:hypothetical protein